MAKSLPVGQPLGYVGIKETDPPNVYIIKRAPTVTDYLMDVGDVWINPLTDNIYMMSSKSGAVGTWQVIAQASGSLNAVNADAGTATPAGGVITIVGGTNIDTAAVGANLTINLSSTVNTTTVNATTLSTSNAAAKLTLNGTTLSSTGTDVNIPITISPKGSADLTLDGLKWPQADGTVGQVLKTDGAAQLGWASVGGDVTGPGSATDNAVARFDLTTGKIIQNSTAILTDVGALSGLTTVTATNFLTDTAQYLNISGSSIVAAGAAGDINITITPQSSGKIILDGQRWPNTLGTATYVLTTDGAGTLSWSAAATGNVVGPGSSTDRAVPIFDGITGKLLAETGFTIDGSDNMSCALGTISCDSYVTSAAAGNLTITDNIIEAKGSVADVNIEITPKGAGKIKLDAVNWPNVDGALGQYLATDGAGNAIWSVPAGAGNVVGPASSTDEALARFDLATGKLLQNSTVLLTDAGALSGITTATATMFKTDVVAANLEIAGDTITAEGSDVNVDVVVVPKGTGALSTTLGAITTLNSTTVTATTLATADAAAGIEISGNSILSQGTDANISLNITPKGTGDLVLDSLKWPQVDGTANQVLRTSGSGQLSWVDHNLTDYVVGPASATDNALARYDLTTGKLLQDSVGILTDAGALSGITTATVTTLATDVPTANLQISGSTIEASGSDTDVDINITPKAAGNLILDSIKWPQADGLANQVLKTDGSSQLGWVYTGTGDLIGPAGASDNAISRYNGSTGKLVQNSSVLIDDGNNITGVVNITATKFITDIATANLDISGTIISGAGSDAAVPITILPKGAADLTLGILKWPQADGTINQVLKTNGSLQLGWTDALNGDVVGPASANDERIARFDTGTGKLLQNSTAILSDTGALSGITTVTATQFSTSTANKLDISGTTIAASGVGDVNITLTPQSSGKILLDGQQWPNAIGTATYVLTTDAGGVLSWTDNPSGDVVGPGAVTDRAVPIFDGITGALLAETGFTIDGSDNMSCALGTISCDSYVTSAAAGNLTITDNIIEAKGSVADVDIQITPKLDGKLILDGLKWPIADGTVGQYLKTDGSTNLSWAVPAGAGDVVGPVASTDNAIARFNGVSGDVLDDCSILIDDSDNVTGIVSVTATTFKTDVVAASLEMAGNSVIAAGTDTDIDITITPKGAGVFSTTVGEITTLTSTTVTSTTLATADAAAGLEISGNSILSQGTDTNISLNITPKGTGDLVLDSLKWPQVDGTAGQILRTSGSGQLSWVNNNGGTGIGSAGVKYLGYGEQWIDAGDPPIELLFSGYGRYKFYFESLFNFYLQYTSDGGSTWITQYYTNNPAITYMTIAGTFIAGELNLVHNSSQFTNIPYIYTADVVSFSVDPQFNLVIAEKPFQDQGYLTTHPFVPNGIKIWTTGAARYTKIWLYGIEGS